MIPTCHMEKPLLLPFAWLFVASTLPTTHWSQESGQNSLYNYSNCEGWRLFEQGHKLGLWSVLRELFLKLWWLGVISKFNGGASSHWWATNNSTNRFEDCFASRIQVLALLASWFHYIVPKYQRTISTDTRWHFIACRRCPTRCPAILKDDTTKKAQSNAMMKWVSTFPAVNTSSSQHRWILSDAPPSHPLLTVNKNHIKRFVKRGSSLVCSTCDANGGVKSRITSVHRPGSPWKFPIYPEFVSGSPTCSNISWK